MVRGVALGRQGGGRGVAGHRHGERKRAKEFVDFFVCVCDRGRRRARLQLYSCTLYGTAL